MYQRTYWRDHVIDQSGAVIQQGTPQDQAHFNNEEVGISDTSMAAAILGFGYLQARRVSEYNDTETQAEILGEIHTVKLTNTGKYPFNSTMDTPVTVALTKNRRNLFYSVEAIVRQASGIVGNIHITDKAINGFKVSFDGSAASATVDLRIKGGIA